MSARKVGGGASKFGALGFTLIAIILTLVTAFLLAKMMGTTRVGGQEVTNIVVASQDLNAAEPIYEEHLKLVQWPKASVPEGAFLSIDDFLVKVRSPARMILQGEPVLEARLASEETGTGMAAVVPKDFRAFPVAVDKWVTKARLVYPGALVDVLTTIKSNRQVSTKIVLQAIRVLAVDGSIDPVAMRVKDGDKKNNDGMREKTVVTLLVTPSDAEALALANREGELDLILRNANDEALEETLGLQPYELLGQVDPEELKNAEKRQQEAAKREQVRERLSRRKPKRPPPAPVKPTGPVFSGGTKSITIGGSN
ncbi:Flp pilus assembly protein CpaB [Myxococcota bacterium]|nr:Flp pilus assembly protein CpaB [Myxococcota bacterium]MBU1432935.1 Flp pilus assembly protein CpaB [Myxococcota bacterium]MBU1896237.1 Flp pilus assembly protein CpaB [Myxococcota bacterium]